MAWDPETYPKTIRNEVHDYDRLQDEVAKATLGSPRRTILDLGVGSGETAGRVLDLHPEAHLVGVDSSREMLRGAAALLPPGRVTFIEQDLSAPLPERSFDLVISALAIHHLEGVGKARLFRDVRSHLAPGGCFVIGDVIVPENASDALIEIESGYDFPSTVEDHVRWLTEAGLSAEVVWVFRDLAVLKGEPSRPQV
jgi:tRNA (cmo5U34)-methyltransferase